jgi:hypothetical protein
MRRYYKTATTGHADRDVSILCQRVVGVSHSGAQWVAFSNSVVIYFSIAFIRWRHSNEIRKLAYGMT